MKTQKQEESPVKQRLATFAKSQQISVRKFERSCGLTEGYINAIRVAPGPDKVAMILKAYPELNVDWLLTGEGEMVKKEEKVSGEVKRLMDLVLSQQETIRSQAETIIKLASAVAK